MKTKIPLKGRVFFREKTLWESEIQSIYRISEFWEFIIKPILAENPVFSSSNKAHVWYSWGIGSTLGFFGNQNDPCCPCARPRTWKNVATAAETRGRDPISKDRDQLVMYFWIKNQIRFETKRFAERTAVFLCFCFCLDFCIFLLDFWISPFFPVDFQLPLVFFFPTSKKECLSSVLAADVDVGEGTSGSQDSVALNVWIRKLEQILPAS